MPLPIPIEPSCEHSAWTTKEAFVWNEALLNIPGYAFHACNRGSPQASHAIGCAKLSEDTLAFWAIRIRDSVGRSKLSNELETALVRQPLTLVLSSLNDAMCHDYPDASSHAETCVMVLDVSAHILRTAAAGDFLPELRTPADDVLQLDRTRVFPPLGSIPSVEYDTKAIDLAPRTSVIWISPYTTQIQNPSGQIYGSYGLPEQVRAAPSGPALMVQHITSDIETFAGSRGLTEDICIICIRRVE